MNFLQKCLSVVRWSAAIFIALMGIAFIANKSPFTGILWIGISLVLVPALARRMKVKRMRFFRTALVATLFFGSAITMTVMPPVYQEANKQALPMTSPQLPAGSQKASSISTPTPSPTTIVASTPSPTVKPSTSPTALPPTVPATSTPTELPTATPKATTAPTPSPDHTGYQWVDNKHGGVNYFNNGAPITREIFGTGANQDVSKIENWVNWVYTGHPNYQWVDNGSGGVNYYLDGRPITREQFQAGVIAQRDDRTDVSKIEAWVKRIYGAKPTPAAVELPAGTLKTIGTRTKTSGCVINGALQDKACSPGAIFAVTAAQVCVSGYSSSVRSVSESTKNAVYAEYGITSHTTGQYEVDHLISLELGGSNDIANLWPEPANPTPGFHQKDSVENSLHSKVCSGAMSLATAQLEIAYNWLSVYNGNYVSSGQASQPQVAPAPAAQAAPAPAPAPASSGVIKKSSTGICHAPGTTYYDRTTNFTPYTTLDACLASGGRLPLK
jgi:hypothetical protein